jgi:hypothetical protein
MTTPLAEYANLRLLIPQPVATPANFRSGVPAPTASWVIEMFAKAETATSDSRFSESLPSIDPTRRTLSGYITAWATLPANTSWLAAATAFTWTTTGLAPAGLAVGLQGTGLLGRLAALPTIAGPAQRGEATIVRLGGDFGPGGIGEILRAELGDAITVELQLPA